MSQVEGQLLGGRYRLRRQLGSGGMGVVYEAWQEDLGRSVAVKLMTGADAEALQRFQREARATAALGHPHIVQIFDFQTAPGEPPFIVMELIAGPSVRDMVKASGPIGEERAARIGMQVASALDAAHRAGVLHRDVKPANVVVTTSPTLGEVAKVLDFGIAKDLTTRAPAITRFGGVIGTLAYMSPEQARGEPLDGRTDVYSLAATLFFAVTGQRSLQGDDSESMFGALLDGRARSLAATRPGLDPEFCAIIDRGLAGDRDARFGSVEALGQTLHRWLESRARLRELHFGSSPSLGLAPDPVLPVAPASALSVPSYAAVPMTATNTAAIGPTRAPPRSASAPLIGLALFACLGIGGVGVAAAAGWYFMAGAEGEARPDRAPSTSSAPTIAPSAAVPAASTSVPQPERAARSKNAGVASKKTSSAPAVPAAKATSTAPADEPAPKKEECASGTRCGAQCVNLRWDSQHCGSCDHACTSGTACQAGFCAACRPPLVYCGGKCLPGGKCQ